MATMTKRDGYKSMTLSDVSVVIPTFNRIGLLKKTIASLERQLPDPTLFEVIVVDDGSTDGTAGFLESYQGLLRLKPEFSPENQGRSRARNLGIAAANRPLLILLDGDMELAPDALRIHSDSHDGTFRALIGRIRHPSDGAPGGYALYWETRGSQGLREGERVEPRHFLTGFASLPKALAIAAGGFSEEFYSYGEDIDFGMRIDQAGGVIRYLPSAEAAHLQPRRFVEIAGLMREFGAATLPSLLSSYPHLRRSLRTEWLDKKTLGATLGRFALNAALPLLNVSACYLDRRGVSSRLYSIASWGNYCLGLASSRELAPSE